MRVERGIPDTGFCLTPPPWQAIGEDVLFHSLERQRSHSRALTLQRQCPIMKKDSLNLLMQLLKDKKLSQERFARIADVSLSTAARWIRGKQVPSMAPWRFIALSRELGVSPEILAEAMRQACEPAEQSAEIAAKYAAEVPSEYSPEN